MALRMPALTSGSLVAAKECTFCGARTINVIESRHIHSRSDHPNMPLKLKYVLVSIIFCLSIFVDPGASLGQRSVAELHKILREKLAFDESELTDLQRGQTIVKLLPVQDKKEVAMAGIVGLELTPQAFLESFRENMTAKTNRAILEIGRFSSQPTLDDLKDLTFEIRDIEDLRNCVVGNCQLKLSASMIARLRKEIDWDAPDHAIKATQLLKVMLVDYVRDYLQRGDIALIEYSDKEDRVRLAEEQLALKATSTYLNDVLTNSKYLTTQSSLKNIENAIVWSKTDFGRKPVISINHIAIYENPTEIGPQVLIASRQIYANHYFNSSLALTGFVNVPNASLGSYLIYENRSRVDGFGGPFGGVKRDIVAHKAVSALTAILEQSKATLAARTFNQTEFVSSTNERKWRRWKSMRGQVLFFGLLIVTASAGLLALSKYRYGWKTEVS